MQQSEFITFIILLNIIILIFLVGIIVFVRQYRKRKLQYIAQTNLLNQSHGTELLKTQLEIQNQTMQHIGQEIHDSVGQKLTLASLYAQQLHYQNPAPNIKAKMESISYIINEALDELRGLCKSLTNDTMAQKTIVNLLQELCSSIQNTNQFNIKLSTNNKYADIGLKTKTIIFRVAQEFIQNSIKHSHCNNILVELLFKEGLFIVTLTDDGNGFDGNKIIAKGIGLENIKKRLAALGGFFTFNSTPNKGTKLHINLPTQTYLNAI